MAKSPIPNRGTSPQRGVPAQPDPVQPADDAGLAGDGADAADVLDDDVTADDAFAITLDVDSEREQAPIVISGADFGEVAGTVRFNEVPAPIVSWAPTEIRTTVPYGAASGDLVVRTADGRTAAAPFTVTPGVWTRPGSDAARREAQQQREAQAAARDVSE